MKQVADKRWKVVVGRLLKRKQAKKHKERNEWKLVVA